MSLCSGKQPDPRWVIDDEFDEDSVQLTFRFNDPPVGVRTA